MATANQSNVKGAKVYQERKVDNYNAKLASYAPLVKRVALHLKSRLPPQVDIDDLIQSGMIGLIDALQNYKDGQGATFETYASIRIRGAMIDELRQIDWTPRSVHQNTRAIKQAIFSLSNTLGRNPTDIEVANYLKIDIGRYHQMLVDSHTSQIMCIEDTGLTDDVIGDRPLSEISNHDPEDKLYNSLYSSQFKKAVADAIAHLPEREKQIVTFYYDHELNLREIGLIMGISESRTCQVLSQAMIRLRSLLDDWAGEEQGNTVKHKGRAKEDVLAPGAMPVSSKAENKPSLLFDDVPLGKSSKVASHKKATTCKNVASSEKKESESAEKLTINDISPIKASEDSKDIEIKVTNMADIASALGLSGEVSEKEQVQESEEADSGKEKVETDEVLAVSTQMAIDLVGNKVSLEKALMASLNTSAAVAAVAAAQADVSTHVKKN